jgi:O-antigen ligase
LEWAALFCLLVGLGVTIARAPLTWAVGLVVGLVAVGATLIRPALGVLLVVPAVPFGSLRQVSLGAMNVGATEVLVGLVVIAWLARMVARREIRIEWPALSLPVAVFMGVLLLSTLGSASLPHSLKELIKWAEVLALLVLVSTEIRGKWQRALIVAVLGTGALAALQGIYQFLFQVGPESFVLFGRFMRAYGTFEQPNPFGGYLGLTLPIAFGVVVAAVWPSAQRARRRWLLLAAGCGGLMLAALVMTWSRGAWLGLAAAVGTMILTVVVRRGRAALWVTVLAMLVSYGLLAGGAARVPPSIVERFSDLVPFAGVTDVRGVEVTDANFAVVERMAHWQAALAMWTDHPWLGVGIGNYEVAYGEYALPLWSDPLGHAHNYYLNIAAESGVLGLAAYLLLWGTALAVAWRATASSAGWAWGIALGILGALVHLAVHNLFDNLFVHGMYLQIAILLGILSSLRKGTGDIEPN